MPDALGRHVAHDIEKTRADQPLRAPDEERRRTRGLGALEVFAHGLQRAQCILARGYFTGSAIRVCWRTRGAVVGQLHDNDQKRSGSI